MDTFLQSHFFEKAFEATLLPSVLLRNEADGFLLIASNASFRGLGNRPIETAPGAMLKGILEKLPNQICPADTIINFLKDLINGAEAATEKCLSVPAGIWQGRFLGELKDQKVILLMYQQEPADQKTMRGLEEELLSLQSSNANLEQFAYVASHDLQEPLRKLKAFGDMLQNRYAAAMGEEGSDLIRRMQSAAGRMSVLMDDLLQYSRVSLRPTELKVIDTNQVLDGVLLDLEGAIQRSQAIIFHERLSPVAAHPTQLGQVFLNLIGNALKFHRKGVPPEIYIRSKLQRGHETGLMIGLEDAEKEFQVIHISDNGIGFENEQAEQIFGAFQRLNNRSDYPGSGLGLSIVKKIVEHHQGYVMARSRPGEGSIFTLLLPAATA